MNGPGQSERRLSRKHFHDDGDSLPLRSDRGARAAFRSRVGGGNTLGFRGGFATRDDFDGRRSRLVGTLDDEALLVSSDRLVIALFAEWENSLWWYSLPEGDPIATWSGYHTQIDLILAIGAQQRSESRVRVLLGFGGSGKVGLGSLQRSIYQSEVDIDVDFTEAVIGPVIQLMIRMESRPVTMSGMLRFRSLTGNWHGDIATHNRFSGEYGNYERDVRVRHQTLTVRGQAELRTKPGRFLMGIQFDLQRTIARSEVDRRWPDWGEWPYAWEFLLFGGLRIEL